MRIFMNLNRYLGLILIIFQWARSEQLTQVDQSQQQHQTLKQQKLNSKIQQTLLSSDIELISKEIKLTEEALNLYEKKLEILQKVHEYYKKDESQLLYTSNEFLEEYLGEEKLLKILYNQFGSRFQQYEDSKYSMQRKQLNQKQLANKFTKKSQFNITQNVREVQFLNTFSYRSFQGTTLSYMITNLLQNHTLIIYDLHGQLLIDPYIPGHRIHLLALAPKVDEVIIATLGLDNSIRIGRLENKRIKLNVTEQELNSQNDDEDDFIPKKYIGNSDIPFDEQKNQKQNLKSLNGTTAAGMQYRSRNKTQIHLNNPKNLNNTLNSTLIDLNQKNKSSLNSTQSNNQNTQQTSGYRSRLTKSKKPEKYKYVIQKETPIKLIDYTNSTSPPESIYSSILQITVKGTRLFLIGDKLGNIHVYFRNGTYKGKVKVANEPIIQLLKAYPNTIYATKSQIGQFNPLQQDIALPVCESIAEGIKEIQPDSIYNSHFYLLTQNNEVLLIEMRTSDNSCRIKQKLNQFELYQKKSLPDEPDSDTSLIVIKNNLMIWNNQNNLLKVFNTSDILQEQTELYEPFDIEIQKKQNQNSTLNYKYQKITSTSTYILVHEKNQNISNIAVFEVTIPQKQETDFINNIRVPILIVAVVVFILYQYFKKDQDEAKTTFSDINSKLDKKSEEEESKPEQSKKSLNAIENGPSEGGNAKESNTSSQTSSISQIQQKNQQLSNLTPIQKQNKNSSRYKSGKMHDIDDIDYRKYLHY
ncbi:hypothetical protein TTHERM_00852890 (macronuclear) [Tetrahymena thermophila SB210]|uniref:Transmembrane protein n=1 Tax=Tetrahymena thermophila (strain SB210) TaxID=312017 RepID=Q24E51_TETTS|nr:hypothetical protein TTHERM_00852890 [Tetrahymena thermophila SB210]EAS06050.2 hypothetical protein TTHERM_00852890 [Tetrahymena thermophila SB210]|eukprot:XP_001026295.2 hypothetical protein TTHERM_00852890 [Tetrahymena thermophila SB210]